VSVPPAGPDPQSAAVVPRRANSDPFPRFPQIFFLFLGIAQETAGRIILSERCFQGGRRIVFVVASRLAQLWPMLSKNPGERVPFLFFFLVATNFSDRRKVLPFNRFCGARRAGPAPQLRILRRRSILFSRRWLGEEKLTFNLLDRGRWATTW